MTERGGGGTLRSLRFVSAYGTLSVKRARDAGRELCVYCVYRECTTYVPLLLLLCLHSAPIAGSEPHMRGQP